MYRDYVNQALKYQSDLRDRKLDVVGLKVLLLEPSGSGVELTNLTDQDPVFKVSGSKYLKLNTNFLSEFRALREEYISEELFNFETVIPVNSFIKNQSRLIFKFPNPDNLTFNYVFYSIYSQEVKKLDIIYSKKAFLQTWKFTSKEDTLGFWTSFFDIQTESLEDLSSQLDLDDKELEQEFKNILNFLDKKVYTQSTQEDTEENSDFVSKTEELNSEDSELLFKF